MVRVDDTHLARVLMESIGDSYTQEEGLTETTALIETINAQTHATLAVAEQLRIGNMIALAKLAGREEDAHEELAQVAYQALDQFIDWKMTSDDDAMTFLAPDIAEALGIGGQ